MPISVNFIRIPLAIAGGLFAIPAFAQEFELIHANINPATHIDHVVNEDFVNRVEQLSDGRITFRVFDGGTLGDERETLEQLTSGTIGSARLTLSVQSSLCPQISILNLPFLFTDGRSLLDATRSDEFIDICDDTLVQKGVRPLSYLWMGARDLYTKKPVENLADLRGMKIRTLQDPYVVKAWTELGAIPTPISFSELYTSLQTGTVDGAEGWAASYNSRSFYEVAPHLSRVSYIQIATSQLISEKVWQTLPEDLRLVMQQAAQENSEFAFEYFSGIQSKIYTDAASHATVHDISDLDKWVATTAPVFQEYSTDNPGAAAGLLSRLTK